RARAAAGDRRAWTGVQARARGRGDGHQGAEAGGSRQADAVHGPADAERRDPLGSTPAPPDPPPRPAGAHDAPGGRHAARYGRPAAGREGGAGGHLAASPAGFGPPRPLLRADGGAVVQPASRTPTTVLP